MSGGLLVIHLHQITYPPKKTPGAIVFGTHFLPVFDFFKYFPKIHNLDLRHPQLLLE
jgi:hypothetical protein